MADPGVYTYAVRDVENVFGAHLARRVVLYRGDKRIGSWEFDDLAFGERRARRRIQILREMYGATPR